MDENEVANIFRLTLNPEFTKEAEKKLTEIKYLQSFPQILLKIVESPSLEETVRHSAAIQLKNIIKEKWALEETEKDAEMQREVNRLTVENDLFASDKKFLECCLLPATLQSSLNLIRDQLIVCISVILKRSYPVYMGDLPSQIVNLFTSSGVELLPCCLQITTAMIKSHELKPDERIDALYSQLQPLAGYLARIFAQYTPLDTPEACIVQTLAYKLIVLMKNKNRMVRFLGEENLCTILDCSMRLFSRPPPLSVAPDDGPPSPWSKSRKWAIRIFCEIFRNSRGKRDFMTWFVNRYALDVVQCVFSVFGQITQNIKVSDYVLQYAVSYLRYCITKMVTWRVLNNHVIDIIRHIFIPLLAYNDKLFEQFNTDPQTFIEDYCVDDYLLYPESAIRNFLNSVAKYRSDVLPLIVNSCMQALSEAQDPQRYAVFSVLGFIAPTLVKNEVYKNDMENLFVTHVFPATKSANPLIRYRSYWLLEALIKVPFRQRSNEKFVVDQIVNGILNESAMPVQYQAIFLLDKFMNCATSDVLNMFIPYISPFTSKIMAVIRETNCQSSSYVLEKIFEVFADNIAPVAYDIVQNSVHLIISLVQNTSNLPDTLPVISGVVSAIDTVVDSIDDNFAIIQQISPLIEQILNLCFSDDLIIEMWDDFCMLLCTATSKRVPPVFWKYFYRFMDTFPKNTGLYSFEAMVDWMHNFITLDSATFLSSPDNFNRVMSVVDLAMSSTDSNPMEMCDSVMLGIKIYEIIMITCKGSLSLEQMTVILNSVYKIYSNEEADAVIKNFCLMTFVSALYSDYAKAVSLCSAVACSPQTLLINDILTKWIATLSGTKSNRHQLKLSLLVITEMVTFSDTVAQQYLPFLMPISLSLCTLLQKEYQKPVKDDEDEDDCEDYYSDASSLESVEYDGNDNSAVSMDQTDDDDDTYDDEEEDDTYYDEIYTTVIDHKDYDMVELIVFNDHLKTLQERDSQYFYMLMSTLNAQQQQQLNTFSDQISKIKLEKQSVQR